MAEGDSKLHVNESDPKLLDLQSVAAEMQRLHEENIRLQCLLTEHGNRFRRCSPRLCLCSSLENADGRYGYMPKADRDWKAYLRAKDEDRKKVDRQTRKFRRLTDEVVRGHLVGDHTIGICPLLQGETCCLVRAPGL